MAPGRALLLEFDGTLVESCNADLVVLQARDLIGAIRLRATRLAVIRRGFHELPPKLKPGREPAPARKGREDDYRAVLRWN